MDAFLVTTRSLALGSELALAFAVGREISRWTDERRLLVDPSVGRLLGRPGHSVTSPGKTRLPEG